MGWPYPLVRWVWLWNRPSVVPLLPLPEDVGYQINQSLCGGNRDIGIVEEEGVGGAGLGFPKQPTER